MFKKTINYLILSCFLGNFAFAQIDSVTFINKQTVASDTLYNNSSTDSNLIASRNNFLSNPTDLKKNIDTSAVIYGWKLDNNFVQPEKTEIDTDLVSFQNYNPVTRRYLSISNLGNVGSAFLSNNFFERDYTEDLLYLNSYKDYFFTFDKTSYINTLKPFTHIIYYNGGSKRDKFESLEFYHTQNVAKKFNFGLDIKILSDKGQFKYLDIKNKSFKIFASYSGTNYKMHTNANLNRYQAGENGGIIESTFENTEQKTYKVFPVNFSGIDGNPFTPYVTNKVRYVDALVSQQIKLFTIGQKPDSVKSTGSIAEPVITHVLIARRSSKIYTDPSKNNPEFPIYRNTFSNPLETYDSIAELRITNKLQLDFKTKIKRRVSAGVFANINYDFIKYTYYSLMDSTSLLYPDTISYDAVNKTFNYFTDSITSYRYKMFNDTILNINRNNNISNLYISGGLYGKFWTYFQSQFSATLYLMGYKAGESHIDGEIFTQLSIFSKPYRFIVKGSIENIKPLYQLNNYYSNNYAWEADFNYINRLNLSSKIAAPSNKFELWGNYSLLRNYIYLTDSAPKVYDQAINLMSLGVEKEFKVWKFHIYNKLIYQVSENRNIIEVPAIIYYNSTYFDHTWKFAETGGEFRTMLGCDVHYNSNFNGYNYIPALALFYQGNDQIIGNYPFIDFWFSVKLKRTRFFVKYEHANSDWYRKDYYNAITYPANPKMLKFGISWTFYD